MGEMLSLETARKLKEAGLKWEPQVGDLVYHSEEKEFFYITADDMEAYREATSIDKEYAFNISIFIPRLDQLLAETEKRKSDYRLSGSQTMEGKWLYKIRVWGEGEGWDFIGNSPKEAAAAGLIRILELENNKRNSARNENSYQVRIEAIERAMEAEERVLALESSMQMFKDMCMNSPTQELDEQYYKEKIAALREENEKLKNELGSVKYIRDKYQGELVAKEILDDEFENGELVKLLAVVEAASDKRKLVCEPCKSKVIGEYEEKPNCNACVLGSIMQALANLEGGQRKA